MLKYLRVLVWPTVTLAAIWTLRAQLRAAVERMTRVETVAGSIEFAAEARDVLNRAENAAAADQPPAAPYNGLLSYPPQPWQPPPGAPAGQDAAADAEPVPVPQQGDAARNDLPSPPPLPFPQQAPGGGEPPAGEPAGPSPEAPPWSYGYPPQPRYEYPLVYPFPPGPRQPAPGGGYDGVEAGRRSQRLQDLRHLRYTAGDSPLTAVLDAWEILYGLVLDVTASAEEASPRPQPPSRRSAATAGRQLQVLGLSRESGDVFDRLRDLRNRAAHRVTDVTPVAARDFVESCLALAREIEMLEAAIRASGDHPDPPW